MTDEDPATVEDVVKFVFKYRRIRIETRMYAIFMN
jgi:hypothetical protein